MKKHHGNSNPSFTMAVESHILSIVLVCSAIISLFSTQNLMAPNLASISNELHEEDRDGLAAHAFFASSILSLPFALFLGILADQSSRRCILLVGMLILGVLASLWTIYVQTTFQLFLTQLLNGIAMGGALPIVFSMLGDMFPSHQRGKASAAVSAAMGFGVLAGQIVSGLMGPQYGWRSPYGVMAILCMGSALLVFFYLEEPNREILRTSTTSIIGDTLGINGIEDEFNEKKNDDLTKSSSNLCTTLKAFSFRDMFRCRSNVYLILQGFPGSIPVGVCFVYLNDFLSHEKGLSVEQATLVVGCFGIGAAISGVFGGLLGQHLYNRSNRLLPLVLGISTVLAVIPMYFLINGEIVFQNPNNMQETGYFKGMSSTFAYSFFAGLLVGSTGANVRALLLNVNPPDSRASVLSVSNFINNVGRGMGPVMASALMTSTGDRATAFTWLMSLWIVCGGMLAMASTTVQLDEDRVLGRSRPESLRRHPIKRKTSMISMTTSSQRLRLNSGRRRSIGEAKDLYISNLEICKNHEEHETLVSGPVSSRSNRNDNESIPAISSSSSNIEHRHVISWGELVV